MQMAVQTKPNHIYIYIYIYDVCTSTPVILSTKNIANLNYLWK